MPKMQQRCICHKHLFVEIVSVGHGSACQSIWLIPEIQWNMPLPQAWGDGNINYTSFCLSKHVVDQKKKAKYALKCVTELEINKISFPFL